MKKLLSVFLVLVMVLGMLSGITLAADPVQVTQDQASVEVYSESDPDTKYYFETISQDLVSWVCKNLAGNRVIKLLGDVDVSAVAQSTTNRQLEIPASNSLWNSKDYGKLTFDLDGKTLTYSGANNLFFVQRYGFTLKNGTVIYNGTASRAPIVVGTSAGQTATSGGSKWTPVINLDGVTMVNTQNPGGWISVNYVYDTTFNITDSVLWACGSSAFMLRATNQTGIGSATALTGSPNATVNLVNSTVGAGSSYALYVDATGQKINIDDSIIVNNANSDTVYDTTTDATVNTNGQSVRNDGEWFITLEGKHVGGVAYIYGDAISAWDDDLTWEVADGKLTLGGEGRMREYSPNVTAPWYASASDITLADIGSGVIGINRYAFYGCSKMTELALGTGVTAISAHAFNGCTALTDVYFAGTEKQWEKISIGEGNEALTNATIHFEHPFKTRVDRKNGVVPQFAFDTSVATGTGNYAVITAGDSSVRIEQADWVKGPGKMGNISYDGIHAKDLTQTVRLSVYNASGTLLTEQSVSVYDALKAQMDATTSEKKAAGYAALLHYGAAAQKYFDYNTGNLADKDLGTMADVSRYRKDDSFLSGDDTSMVYGTSCILGTQLQLKFYFTANDKTVLVNGEAVELSASPTEGYYYCLADVAPESIFETVTVQVKDGNMTLATIKDSVASYCARLYAKGGEKNETLADALLNYGVASSAADTSNYADVSVNVLTEKSLLKTHGRTYLSDTGLSLDFAGSAVEFEAELVGDVTVTYNADVACYFTTFVDGVETNRVYSGVGTGKELVVVEDVEPGMHNIRIVRDTDATKKGETMEFVSVAFSGIKSTVKAPAESSLYIEFVGDSITAGKYTEDGEGDFIHKGTNSYAYLTAEALDADYSMLCRGGCGYFRISTCPKTMNQLYPYYNGFEESPVAYTGQRQADVVVIAMGTNDGASNVTESYQNGTVPFATFEEAVKDLVTQARTMHGEDVKIILLHNMMAGTWETEYQNVAAEMGLYILKVTRDNSGGNNHPSKAGQAVIAQELTEYLQNTVLK